MHSWPLVTAAILAFVIGIIHSWVGERVLIGPLLHPEKRQGILAKSWLARQTLRFAWHLTTIAWWGLGAVALILSRTTVDETGRMILMTLAVTFLLSGVGTFIFSRGRHLAWIIFLAIAGLTGFVAIW